MRTAAHNRDHCKTKHTSTRVLRSLRLATTLCSNEANPFICPIHPSTLFPSIPRIPHLPSFRPSLWSTTMASSTKSALMSAVVLLASTLSAEAAKISFHRSTPQLAARNLHVSRTAPSRISREQHVRLEAREDHLDPESQISMDIVSSRRFFSVDVLTATRLPVHCPYHDGRQRVYSCP